MNITPLGGRHIGYGLGKTQRREAAALPLFADGFESGDLTAWSSSVTNGGQLSVSEAAAMVGDYGMQIVVNNTVGIYVRDDTPNNDARYRFRFYFDPNSIAMVDGDSRIIFQAYATAGTTIINITFAFIDGVYKLRRFYRADGGSNTSSYTVISDTAHYLEMDWKVSSAPGANDGHIKLWIDGIEIFATTNIDNDTRYVDYILYGLIGGLAGSTGTLYYDDFVSNNTGAEIGPA